MNIVKVRGCASSRHYEPVPDESSNATACGWPEKAVPSKQEARRRKPLNWPEC